MALSQLGENITIWKDGDVSRVNSHINVELKNFATYHAIAAFLDRDTIGLHGLAMKFRAEALEGTT